jgi:flagellin-like protein
MNIFHSEKRGVSPVIAVVLMIAVAVAIAVIVYAWASGFASEKTGAEGAEAEQMILESQKISGGALYVYLRNATSTVAVVDTVYKNGVLVGSNLGITLNPNEVTEIDVTSETSTQFQAGDEVMIVTEEGTQLKFIAKCIG